MNFDLIILYSRSVFPDIQQIMFFLIGFTIAVVLLTAFVRMFKLV